MDGLRKKAVIREWVYYFAIDLPQIQRRLTGQGQYLLFIFIFENPVLLWLFEAGFSVVNNTPNVGIKT